MYYIPIYTCICTFIYTQTHTHKLIWAPGQCTKTISDVLQDDFLSMTFLLETAVWHACYSKETFTVHKMLTPLSHIFLKAVLIQLFLADKLVVMIVFLFV